MKKCPFCAEQIQDEAVKCRFCNEFLDPRVSAAVGKPQTSWYFKNSTIFFGFFLVGPCVLPLVWLNPRYSLITKTLVSLVITVVSIYLYKLFMTSWKSLSQYYDVISGNY